MSRSHLNNLIFAIINLLCLANVLESLPAQRLATSNDSAVIYQRYVRKRPSPYEEDSSMEEIHEVFETRHRPPSFATFTDDEIDKILRCDIKPHLKECEKLRKQQDTTNLVPPFYNPDTIPTTTTAPLLATTVKSQPFPTLSTLRPYKPTPAIDPYPPATNQEYDIPMLPPISEENIEAESTTLNAIPNEAENDGENDGENEENYEEDAENVDADEEYGDDY